ncbi:MAG: ATP synthase F0 subunit B [Candidatus Wallbacteria bacterium HGW-Wallbacteria-1]|jgi:F-type H+-transporting ATPase subunit b|uniref:ATP synthase subunit b n=1 Tax=Candidatus Wallbacteria bacterium HGW-Wallbacteria-1 TaxID=2013854 RepID=A0A2N1PSN4_9BACT|nr:MAG: ATP synthase F0 subunit B [Candidatus Wallbacteria bacterium HGW-Wallbacteria-1]
MTEKSFSLSLAASLAAGTGMLSALPALAQEAKPLIGAARDGGMININFTMVMQVVNFAILMFLMVKILYKPLLQVLDERSRVVRESLEAARAKDEAAAKVLEDYRAQIEELRSQMSEHLSKARREAEEEKHKMIESAQLEARGILEKTNREIAMKIEEAQAGLRAEIANLAVEVAGKVVGRSFSSEDNVKYIEDYLDKVEKRI